MGSRIVRVHGTRLLDLCRKRCARAVGWLRTHAASRVSHAGSGSPGAGTKPLCYRLEAACRDTWIARFSDHRFGRECGNAGACFPKGRRAGSRENPAYRCLDSEVLATEGTLRPGIGEEAALS